MNENKKEERKEQEEEKWPDLKDPGWILGWIILLSGSCFVLVVTCILGWLPEDPPAHPVPLLHNFYFYLLIVGITWFFSFLLIGGVVRIPTKRKKKR